VGHSVQPARCVEANPYDDKSPALQTTLIVDRLRNAAWILEQWDYATLLFDGYELLGYDASTIPDTVHFPGIVDSVAQVFDAPRLGSTQLFRAGHVSRMGQIGLRCNWENT
jgi:hypothetical protein